MKRTRTNRLAQIRPDFAPFVAIALILLLAFFCLKILAKSNVMTFATPHRGCGCCSYRENPFRHINALLDEENVYLFRNTDDENIHLKSVDYHDFLKAISLEKKRVLSSYQGEFEPRFKDDLPFVVIIKPLPNSNFGQMVSVLNDLKKEHISRYAFNPILLDREREILRNLRMVKK